MSAPIHEPRHMRIICVGAGLSGLCLAYKLQRSFDKFSLTIYEKNTGVGGVWFENRYPGCACDYPAHNYTYSFAPKADFSRAYAGAAEIRGYFEDFAAQHGLHQYIRPGHQVKKATWLEQKNVWHVETLDLASGKSVFDECDIFVNACGALNDWKYPDIAGLQSFKGTLMHSACWDTNATIDGKRVGLIGNGSSGQQISTAIQPGVAKLTTFIRQANWVLGPFGELPRVYDETELEAWKADPKLLLAKRKEFETKVNTYYGVCFKASAQQARMRKAVADSMASKIGTDNEQLRDMLIPNYAVGCRRPTPGIGYLESLTADNSEVVQGEIRAVTEDGVVDHSDKLHELDVLICATGFNTSYVPRFPLIGEGGRNLQDAWKESPRAYLAIAAPECPNYFVFYGPNNPFASGPFMATVEAQADYILKWCDRWQTERIAAFTPKKEAIDEFYEHTAAVLNKLVWTDSCSSWYKSHKNDQSVRLWPGSGLHYMETINEIRTEDWNIRYSGNRWSYLGDGFSRTEIDPDADKAYYLDVTDNTPFLSKGKRKRSQSDEGQRKVIAAGFDGFQAANGHADWKAVC